MPDNIAKDITEIRVAVSRIEEHLKTLNGTVARHEAEIKSGALEVMKNKISLTKVTTIVSLAGGLSGFIAHIVFELLLT